VNTRMVKEMSGKGDGIMISDELVLLLSLTSLTSDNRHSSNVKDTELQYKILQQNKGNAC